MGLKNGLLLCVLCVAYTLHDEFITVCLLLGRTGRALSLSPSLYSYIIIFGRVSILSYYYGKMKFVDLLKFEKYFLLWKNVCKFDCFLWKTGRGSLSLSFSYLIFKVQEGGGRYVVLHVGWGGSIEGREWRRGEERREGRDTKPTDSLSSNQCSFLLFLLDWLSHGRSYSRTTRKRKRWQIYMGAH